MGDTMRQVDYAQVGEKIKVHRQALGISQEALAELCNVSASYVGHIERGTRRLSLNVALRLADILHIGLDYLFLDSAESDEQTLLALRSLLDSLPPEQRKKFLNTATVLAENAQKL